jgi:hypothetical protein
MLGIGAIVVTHHAAHMARVQYGTREVEVPANERWRHPRIRTREQERHGKRQWCNKRQRRWQTGDFVATCASGGSCLGD